MANFVYVRQKGPYGNGTPLLNVRQIVGDEPFLYTWSDDFIKASPRSRFQQLIDLYDEYGCSVMAGVKVKHAADYDRYGFAGGKVIRDGLIDVDKLIEKPGKKNAPSDLATVSGFILTPDIFDYLERAQKNLGEGDELYYNDALKLMLQDGKRVLAAEIKNGKYYDTGNKLEYLKTVVEFALEHPDIQGEFREYLEKIMKA
jgi:UTP--glucose-1-phosphate uridylyltransferase